VRGYRSVYPNSDNPSVEIRLLEPGDEAIVERLATREPRTALLRDPRTIFLVAFDGEEPAGFVLAYELPRRHGFNVTVIVYEVEVDDAYRRQGIATLLLRELEQIARGRGIEEAFVLTEPDNLAANRLYETAGGTRSDVVEWDFDYTGA
jgi:aminoglycoside 3-N-acetyltransferase I